MSDGGALDEGVAALARGDWHAAIGSFESVLEHTESPDARLGLGTAHMWLGEMAVATRCYERAYGEFCQRDDVVNAVLAATNLSLLHNANYGNRAAAAGWAARASRLAEGVPVLEGWAAMATAANSEDPDEAQRLASGARAAAVEAGDRDLELCAMSVEGSALVDAGRVEAGAALLDEALAGAIGGEVESPDTVVLASCLMMQCCVRGADFGRVVEWSHALDGFVGRFGSPYLNASCRAHHGAVLAATGDWPNAEVELTRALDLAGSEIIAVRAEAAAFLADLRLAQGRVEDARRIVDGLDGHPQVMPVAAAIRLAAGEPAVAASIAERRLAVPGSRRLEESRLREVLGEALLAAGDADGAADQGRRLVEMGNAVECDLIIARGQRLVGRACRDRQPVEVARSTFAELGMRLDVARCSMVIAGILATTEPEAASSEAHGALAVFETLGAARDADLARAFVRAAGRTAGLTRRELEVLAAVGEGLSNPEIADRLYISRRTVEHHVANVLAKLGLRNRAEAAVFAVRNG